MVENQSERSVCPCCGYKTLSEKPGTLEICEICYWEDDPFQSADPDTEGWANGVSLRAAQRNFQKFGACRRDLIEYVSPPRASELRATDGNSSTNFSRRPE
ncbi:CPCC family cysteine-rich protein [Pseudochryseolinea flava]|uniref:Cysteine-rich CPCC domain-containing protein n=1 Tax=Pseudochryseolinea flava TaxID=2059302 RepID=A0A364Y509_9BACT|nr:hypothetical protein DQQ10_09350 [Pseudochryseolinea flava]